MSKLCEKCSQVYAAPNSPLCDKCHFRQRIAELEEKNKALRDIEMYAIELVRNNPRPTMPFDILRLEGLATACGIIMEKGDEQM
jgi:hypothetical protein